MCEVLGGDVNPSSLYDSPTDALIAAARACGAPVHASQYHRTGATDLTDPAPPERGCYQAVDPTAKGSHEHGE